MDQWLIEYGQELNLALMIVLGTWILAGLLVRFFQKRLRASRVAEQKILLIARATYVGLATTGVLVALHVLGLHWGSTRKMMFSLILVAALIVLVLRRYIPPLPFKVGDMVEVSGLLGIVESISVVNTRLKAFDGRTFFIPNSAIMKDKIINYHFTANRRVDLTFGVGYADDLLKAKSIVAEILTEDPRILQDPPPRVFVMNLGESSVNVRAWAWTKNSDYFRTRCDLIEKVKLRFDCEGITIAYRQMEVHLHEEAEANPVVAAEQDGR